MKVGWSFADTCTAFQCFQNSPEIFAGLPISSHIFGGINTNYCSTVWIMMIGTIVGVKHSTLSFLQIPLKFCPLCNNSQAIISGTPQFFIRRVNNTRGRWNGLWWLTSRLTGRQAWCELSFKLLVRSVAQITKIVPPFLWFRGGLCYKHRRIRHGAWKNIH